MNINETQLAELLLSIAKANAVALSSALTPEEIHRKVIPALQSASGVGAQSPLSFSNLGPRMLLQSLLSDPRRHGELVSYYASEFVKLLSPAR